MAYTSGRGALLADLSRDIHYSIRTLLRTPGVTILTVLILAMGIGANTAIFSVFKAVFLEPLPLPQSEELTFVWNRNITRGGSGPACFPDFLIGGHRTARLKQWVHLAVRISISPRAMSRCGSGAHTPRQVCSTCWVCSLC